MRAFRAPAPAAPRRSSTACSRSCRRRHARRPDRHRRAAVRQDITGIFVNTDNATLTNLILDGPGNGYGIQTTYNGGVTGLMLSDSLVTDWGAGTYFNPTTGFTATGNSFTATATTSSATAGLRAASSTTTASPTAPARTSATARTSASRTCATSSARTTRSPAPAAPVANLRLWRRHARRPGHHRHRICRRLLRQRVRRRLGQRRHLPRPRRQRFPLRRRRQRHVRRRQRHRHRRL